MIASHKLKSLKICQVNICNLSPNSQLALEKYAWDKELDIIAVQETKMGVPPNLKNYFTYFSPSRGESGKEGGAALYLSKTIKNQTRLSQFEPKDCDIIWMLMTLENKKIIVGTAYIQPENTEHLNLLLGECKRVREYAKKHRIDGVGIWGDFNARSELWSDTATNKNGEILREFLEDQEADFSVVSPGEATFSCMTKDGKMGSSLIDLVICSNELIEHFTCCWVDKEVSLRTGAPGRGHWPIITQLNIELDKKGKNKVSQVYDWKNADWKVWKTTLDNQISDNMIITESEDPVTVWDQLLKEINTSKDIALTKKTVSSFSKPYWNPELSVKARRLRLASKDFTKRSSIENKILLDQLRDDLNVSISEAINQWSERNAANLNTREQGEFWKAYRKNFQEINENNSVDVLEDETGKLIYSPAEKSLMLYNTFFTGKHLENSDFDDDFKESIDKEVHEQIAVENESQKEEEDKEWFEQAFELDELAASLSKIKTSNKSIDGDGIHPILIKQCGPTAKKTILKLCNLCMETGIWVWKTSKVIFLKKSGKPSYQKASAYRPICLTSYVGKVPERLLESRMRLFMNNRNLIDLEQEGFMHNRSTTRYLYRLTSRINASKNNRTVGLLLLIDFEKAYDSVWVEGVLHKLHNAGWTGKPWSLIADYLLSRKLNIRLGDSELNDLACLLGLPQGSILAPLLFIFYISEMLKEVKSDKYKFADDASLFTEKSDKASAIKGMQEDMNLIYAWVKKWRFRINCQKGKTEIMAVNFNPLETDKLFMGENQVEFVKESKILGVWIDANLSWKRQISETRSKAWYAWKKIKNLCSKYYGLKLATIINLVKISVLSTLLYCAPVWADSMEEHFKDLWYSIVKVATGATCKPSKAKLEVLCSLPPLEIQIKGIITKFLIKNYMNHENDLLVEEIDSNVESRGHFIAKHGRYVKEYLGSRQEDSARSSHRLNLKDYRDSEIAEYTESSMWNFTQSQWTRQINRWQEGERFNELLSIKTTRTPCTRATEVYLLSLIHGRVSLNKFLFKLKLTDSPLCSCGKADEDPTHVVFECEEFKKERRLLELDNQSSLIDYMIQAEIKPGQRDINQLCVLVNKIKKKKTDGGRKELKKYFEKQTVDSLKKEGSSEYD